MRYFDHAATTPCRPEVAAAMEPFLTETFGNPSSVHGYGQPAQQALDAARDTVARALGARPEEIVFTGGGTEADNLALAGAWLQCRRRKNHLVTAATEHHAVLHTAEFLRDSFGVDVTFLPVDGEGRVDPADVRRSLRPDTFLVSLMAANNEIGTLAPLAEIGAVCREAGVAFHTDAVQWVGALPLDLRETPVDLLVLTAHKFYGPKGVGALYVRRGVRLQPWLHGGGQERGRRPGTENVAGAVGLARALELAIRDLPETRARVTDLRNQLIERVLACVPDAWLNGPRHDRLPNNAHFSFPGCEGDLLVLNLDLEGIACSSGSACTAGAVQASHVVRALGVPHERAMGSVRLSLGRETTAADVDAAAAAVERVVARLRGRG